MSLENMQDSNNSSRLTKSVVDTKSEMTVKDSNNGV
jgi:hypothetical protein